MNPKISKLFGVAIFALSATSASAALNVFASSATDLNNLNIGDTFTVDIVISTTTPEAQSLGMRADGGAGLDATGNFMAPSSIFNFAPGLPFGGISNIPALLGLNVDGTVNLFQGQSVSPAAGAGPESFSVEFTAIAGGAGTITIGQVASHPEDVYLGGDNVYNSYVLAYNVNAVPEPSTALLMVLGLVGLASARRRG